MEAATSRARRCQTSSATRKPFTPIQSTQRHGTISDVKEAAPSGEGRGQQLSASRMHTDAQAVHCSRSAGAVSS